MDHQEQNSMELNAEEYDWLDISYAERNYVNENFAKAQEKSAKKKIKWKVVVKPLFVAVVCVAALMGLMFVDQDFSRDVFKTAQTAYSSTLINDVAGNDVVQRKVDIPCNVDLIDVKDGIVTFGGGRAALSFTVGVVKNVTDNSVTVVMDDSTEVKYDNLVTTYVDEGEQVVAGALLGKYSQSFNVCISENGEIVKSVVGSSTQLAWNV